MGYSAAILAFDIADADRLLAGMNWRVTNHRVGEAVDISTIPFDELLSPEFQAANNPHFSAARSDQHFFVFTSLKEMKAIERPDFARLSNVAPFTVLIVVETSLAASVERWEGGGKVWQIGGASGIGYETTGDVPIDLGALAQDYRKWFEAIPNDEDFLEPEDLDLPESDEELVKQEFKTLMEDWFANETGFAYLGDHPPLFRLEGTLPLTDMRGSDGG